MNDSQNNPIRWAPSDLVHLIGELQERASTMRRDLRLLVGVFAALEASPGTLTAADRDGGPLDPAPQLCRARGWLQLVDSDLDAAERILGYAQVPSSYLRLTDTAADLRERQLTAFRSADRTSSSGTAGAS